MVEEKKEIRGLKENPDTLKIALKTAHMRSSRLGAEFTVGQIARLGVEMLYEGELAMLRAKKEKFDYDISELT